MENSRQSKNAPKDVRRKKIAHFSNMEHMRERITKCVLRRILDLEPVLKDSKKKRHTISTC